MAAGEHRAVVAAFLRAVTGGDLAGLLAVPDADVTATSDSGGQVSAARRPVHGADRVARFLISLAAKMPGGQRVEVILVNGAAGFVVLTGDRPDVIA